ncbi:MAG: TIGR03016 family PEP-CTERM system-associated outer membrane protein [Nitrospiraceae bacterium]|nr:MAG: TIGR03016 family PEP-CTERM system-associated outer membrane protein [Nitrospiraceae bacterium]
MKKSIYVCLMISGLLLAGASSLSAKLAFTPRLNLSEEYNDNFFLDEKDEEKIFISNFSPGINIRYAPNRRLDFNLDYALDFRFHDRLNEYDLTDPEDIQLLSLKSQVRPAERFYIDVSDVFEKVPIDVRRRTVEGNPLVNKTSSNVFIISPALTIPLTSSISTALGYSFNSTWYDVEEALDYYSHSASLTLSKKFSGKITGALKYNYYAYRVGLEPVQVPVGDYDRHDASVLISYQASPRLRFSGEAGRSRFKFDVSDDSNANFYNVMAELKSGSTDDIVSRIYYAETFHDAATTGTYERKDASILLRMDRPLNFTVRPYYIVDKYLSQDREDKLTGVTADIKRPLSERTDIVLGGSYEKQRFIPEGEKAVQFDARWDFNYRVTEKMTAGLGYRYAGRNSNVDTTDFKNNIVVISAKVSF